MLGRVLTRTEQALLLAVMASLVVGGVSLYHHRHSAGRDSPVIQPATQMLDSSTSAETLPPPMTDPESKPPALEPPASIAEVAVSVTGAVAMPGVFRLRHGARVQDAIAAAGGARDEADLTDLNLAAPLIDGSTLTVPACSSSQLDGIHLTAHGGATAAEINPPQYTISGWQAAGPLASTPRDEPHTDAPDKKSGANQANQDAPPSGLIDLSTATADQLDSLPGIGPKLASEILAYRARTPFTSVEDLTNVSGIGDGKLNALRGLVTVHGAGSTPATPSGAKAAKSKPRTKPGDPRPQESP